MFLYAASRIDDLLSTIETMEGNQYAVSGDAGYSYRVYLEVPFAGENLDEIQTAFNRSISKVRISVKW